MLRTRRRDRALHEAGCRRPLPLAAAGRALRPVRLLLMLALGTAPCHGRTAAADPAANEAALVQIAAAYEQLQRSRIDANAGLDRASATERARATAEDRLATRLRGVQTAQLSADAATLWRALDWRLASSRALRPCHRALWSLDHINGWQVMQPQRLAGLRADSPVAQNAALTQLDALRAYIEQDQANLGAGLALGYSAPQAVVRRVLVELDALLATPPEQSPLFAAARAAPDAQFQQRWRSTLEAQLLPAIRRYRSFLATDYLPRARLREGLSGLPHGRACYAAYLRAATTLPLTPEQVYALGQATVEGSQRELRALARQAGASATTLQQRVAADPDNQFRSAEALLSFTRSALSRMLERSAPLFIRLPDQPVEIEPLSAVDQAAGVPTHYEAQPDVALPARFRLSLADWSHETVGAAEVTVAHETLPGHHLQIATARALQGAARFADLGDNSAYVEGWANYAERLAEEQGLYRTQAAKVFRRVVLGRSLVVDPGIHVFGWSRARARTYLMAAGMSAGAAEDLIDRIAVQPAQLTAYESGGLALWHLREETRLRLGARFQLAAFHQRVLERGAVTLQDLQRYVRRWNGE